VTGGFPSQTEKSQQKNSNPAAQKWTPPPHGGSDFGDKIMPQAGLSPGYDRWHSCSHLGVHLNYARGFLWVRLVIPTVTDTGSYFLRWEPLPVGAEVLTHIRTPARTHARTHLHIHICARSQTNAPTQAGTLLHGKTWAPAFSSCIDRSQKGFI